PPPPPPRQHTPTTDINTHPNPLSLHDALPTSARGPGHDDRAGLEVRDVHQIGRAHVRTPGAR
ncbi:hypothetical protein PJJ82_29960, partial [Mycobacterium kansasii]